MLIEGINDILEDDEMLIKMGENSKKLRKGNPIENIKNDSELLKKYMSEAERRKKKNTAVLKDLGLYER